jgi:glycine dehydrogenase subunit 2
LFEPTETESLDTLDQFAEDLISLVEQSVKDPSFATGAPRTLPVTRLDETRAARGMELTDDL